MEIVGYFIVSILGCHLLVQGSASVWAFGSNDVLSSIHWTRFLLIRAMERKSIIPKFEVTSCLPLFCFAVVCARVPPNKGGSVRLTSGREGGAQHPKMLPPRPRTTVSTTATCPEVALMITGPVKRNGPLLLSPRAVEL